MGHFVSPVAEAVVEVGYSNLSSTLVTWVLINPC